jgi:hypothetical protein
VLCAFSWTKNALFFTKMRAEVLRGEERCVLAGAPIDAATSCAEPRAQMWVVSLCVGIEPCRSGIDTGGREATTTLGRSRASKRLTGHRICLIESHGRNSRGRFAPSWNTVISREATTVIEKFVGQTAVETLMMVRRRGDLITTAAPEELVAIQVRFLGSAQHHEATYGLPIPCGLLRVCAAPFGGEDFMTQMEPSPRLNLPCIVRPITPAVEQRLNERHKVHVAW